MTTSLAIRSVEINRSRVLIVDDDPVLLKALPDTIQLRMTGVIVDIAESAAAALDQIDATDYDVIVTDIKMPGMDGFALLSEIRERRPDTPTLMITGHGEHALAVGALRGGAFDFIQKPIDREYFVTSLRRAIDLRELSRRRKKQQFPLRWLISPSSQMEKIVEQIKQVADSPLTVLVEGETGTGKELVARAIASRNAHRVGALRLREGCIYRRVSAKGGSLPARRRRKSVS